MNYIRVKPRNKNLELYQLIQRRLDDLQIKNFVRLTAKGNQHLVVTIGQTKYSVQRFATTKSFAVFHPWPGDEQKKVPLENYYAVVDFFRSFKT